MRNLHLSILFITCIIISSCTPDDGGEITVQSEKLLKKLTISDSNGSSSLNFFYNENNSIDKIQSQGTGDDFIKQFYYENGNIDRAEFQDLNAIPDGNIEQYIYDNGQLVGREDYFNENTLDEKYEYEFSNALVSEIRYFAVNQTNFSEKSTFQYDSNGNVSALIINYTGNSSAEEELSLTYDNQNNPFNNVTSRIVLIDDFYSFQNNVISQTLTDLSDNSTISTINFTYTYDSDDYPVSSSNGTETITYEYY
ncbi:hypothetical protein AAU57_01740 [Nonlabens sp. YIK11]|uniref:hypothetical protein n=1 Tax=Nonlabens sp. YIK11 TaxID=1453349 RepID=UPI0006DC18DC|nr:hypothetical protein [Nonlabens sp. YIK11]KQC32183.1 hypothetical protein AAU57_01740 [Nonlabens sp. YIK11]